MNEEERCLTCGLPYWFTYVLLPDDARAKTSACPGHVNTSELVTLPHGTQIFPDNEALWDIVKTEIEDASIITDALIRSHVVHGDPQMIHVTCEQCGKCYHGLLEDMQGWYEYVEPSPHRRYAFCSEEHIEQWKVKHGTE